MYQIIDKIINNKKIITIFDYFYLGIISLNSFIWLYYSKKVTDEISYVIFWVALLYICTQLVITIIYRKQKVKRRCILYKNKRIFKCLYMLIYLSILIINIINRNDLFSDYKFLVYNIVIFIYISITGTSFYWFPRLKQKLNFLSLQKNRLDI